MSSGHTNPGQPSGSRLREVIEPSIMARGTFLGEAASWLGRDREWLEDVLSGLVKPTPEALKRLSDFVILPEAVHKFVLLGEDSGWNDGNETDDEGEDGEDAGEEDEASDSDGEGSGDESDDSYKRVLKKKSTKRK